MWIIAENGCGINLQQKANLDVSLSEDVEGKNPDADQKEFCVVAPGHNRFDIVAYGDTREECKKLIEEIIDEMCGWNAQKRCQKRGTYFERCAQKAAEPVIASDEAEVQLTDCMNGLSLAEPD